MSGRLLPASLAAILLAAIAVAEPGFPESTMPQNFGTSISKSNLAALVHYLVQSSKERRK
jgi:hypothetical protein